MGHKKKEKKKDEEQQVLVLTKDYKKFLITKDKDFHMHQGVIKKSDLAKQGKIKTSLGYECYVIKPSFSDIYWKIKRKAQIIYPKDFGAIISQIMPQKDWIVVNAGTGSASLDIMLSPYVKKIYSFDTREDHLKIAKHNITRLGIKNVIINKADIYDYNQIKKFLKSKVDLFVLDVPEPWRAIDTAKYIVKVGGFIVIYNPCITQIMNFINTIQGLEEFIHIKTIECLHRHWIIDGKRVRPEMLSMRHTGFLSFVRKVM